MRTLRIALVALPAGLLACSALLGDFTVTTSDAGDSSPMDMGLPETLGDAQSEAMADASDAAVEYRLHCAESNGTRQKIASSVIASTISVAALPSSHIRVADIESWPFDSGFGYGITLGGYDIDNSHNITPGTLVTPSGGNALALHRYSVGTHSGFVVLFEQSDTTCCEDYLWVSRWPDDQATWTTPAKLVDITSDAGINNLEGEIDVIDPTTDDYFVAYTDLVGTVQTVYGQEVVVSGTPLTSLMKMGAFNSTTGRNAVDPAHPGAAFRNSTGYLMLNPGGNGPPQPGAPAVLLSSTGAQTNITPPGSLNYFPIGFVDAVNPLDVNTAWLIADLNTLTGNYGIGQVATSSLASLNPQALPSTIPTAADGGVVTLKDLMVGGNPVALWANVGTSGEQLTYVGPTYDPVTSSNFGGINFGWWDAVTGTLRSYQAGDAHLFGDVYVYNAASVMTGIVGSVAQGVVAWEQLEGADADTHNNPPPTTDLWIGGIGCLKE